MRGHGPGAAYCPRCAAALPGPPPCACAACGYRLFVNARPTVGLIVLDGRRFLAVRRVVPPRAGLWELPGGFCDGWEHPADAALREAREELGAAITLGRFIGMYVGSYEYQSETLPVLDTFYLATLAGPVRLNAAEASEMTWFDLAKPPPLAFATMDRAVADAARQVCR
ncbi:NUDIX domain-containing protein [Plantactinospora sp. GCM10030261]|uniref:NUDIX domain-containing protein n=1 Tax=Plantactinospora sp. GCM10030261 TaxID=3273420 RepID=UPI00361CC3CD